MAPETLTGQSKSIGPNIDIWAMGVILFALVCGDLPFGGNTSEEILDKIIHAKYRFP